MPQPNILVICSDEHHHRMSSFMNHRDVRTPNLDRLAAQGAVFNNAYCTCPVCTPSRMSFITGKYVHQIDNWFIGVPLDPDEMTWARRLDIAGIPATMLGKMDFCGKYQSGGFSDYKIIEKRGAFSPYPRVAPLASRLSGYVRPDKRRLILNSGVRKDVTTDGSNGHNDQLGFFDHDRIVTDWAIDFLREKGTAKDKAPWALYVGLLYPHWPYCVPEQYFNMYDPDKIELPHDCVIPENTALHPELRHFQAAQNLDGVTESDVRRTIAAYYGMITAMDDRVGAILDELDAQGLTRDTYVIYTSDHGESLGEHGLFYKQSAYEGSVAVPLIVSGPEIPSGVKIDVPVSLVDMYPTILDMAGLEPEEDRPGISWKALAQGKESLRNMVFAEYHGNFFRKSWYMLRDSTFKYIYYVDGGFSLYNLITDPLETNDLASDPSFASIAAEFETALRLVVDPEKVSLRSKCDLGLIGPDGEDYTKTLSVSRLKELQDRGAIPFQPEFEDDYEGEMI